MNEKVNHVLDQYPVEVRRITRVRGGYVLDTPEGLKLLQEYKGGLKKLILVEELLTYLREQGFPSVDLLVRTKQDELTATDYDGTTYVLKLWYAGKECDYGNRQDLYIGMNTLAELHGLLKQTNFFHGDRFRTSDHSDLGVLFLKRNREMRRVRNFISEQNRKTVFEYSILQSFDEFYGYGMEALKRLENSGYRALRENAREKGTMIHGGYHYHNIIIPKLDMWGQESGMTGLSGYVQAAATDLTFYHPLAAITNFEKTDCDLQVRDVYVFLRKVLEKHNWSVELGQKLLDIYENRSPMEKKEREVLKIQMLFPEKYWKLMNYYFNHTKAWMPEKNLEKLSMIQRQQEQKLKFVETIR